MAEYKETKEEKKVIRKGKKTRADQIIEEEVSKNALHGWLITKFVSEGEDAKELNQQTDDIKKWCKLFCKKWVFQLELSPENQKLHYQMAVSLKSKRRMAPLLENLKFHNMEGAHLTPMMVDGKAAFDYCMKDETRFDGPWSHEDGEEPADLKDIVLRPWQKKIADDLLIPCDKDANRVVSVLVDPAGGSGKSTLFKYLRFKRIAQVLGIMEKGDDYSKAVMSTGKAKNGFCFDVARSITGKRLTEFWAGVEQVKSGYVWDQRYSFKDMTFTNPKVWVFMNELPELAKLSSDRWDVWIIRNQEMVRFSYPRWQFVCDELKEKEKKSKPAVVKDLGYCSWDTPDPEGKAEEAAALALVDVGMGLGEGKRAPPTRKRSSRIDIDLTIDEHELKEYDDYCPPTPEFKNEFTDSQLSQQAYQERLAERAGHSLSPLSPQHPTPPFSPVPTEDDDEWTDEELKILHATQVCLI